MSLAMPSTNYNPTPPANFTTAESASTTASNNDDLLGGMILEVSSSADRAGRDNSGNKNKSTS